MGLRSALGWTSAMLASIALALFGFARNAPVTQVAPQRTAATTHPTADAQPAVPMHAVAGPARLQWHDPLGEERDLRRLFERDIGSANDAERAMAWRAWSSCMPAFLGTSDRPASPEMLAAGFAKTPEFPARLEAMRALFERCGGFVAAAHDTLVEQAARLAAMHRRGEARSHADTAHALLTMGEREAAIDEIGSALASGDPYELRELAAVFGSQAGTTDRDPAIPQAALTLASCDLGAACGPDSLLNAQLCAMHGRCANDVIDAVQASLDAAQRDAVRELRSALTQAIRREDRAAALRILLPDL